MTQSEAENMEPPARRAGQSSAAAKLRPRAAIVPSLNIPSRSLIVVIAIMTFLACLTLGGVLAVRAAASNWQTDIARELTVQIVPADGADIDAETAAAAAAAQSVPGVKAVRSMDQSEIGALLAPWLGSGADLSALPVPRIVIVEINPGAPPDLDRLRQAIRQQAPHASLDDHQIWQSRLRIMAQTLTGTGLVILALVLAATGISVIFATTGAMAGNRDVVEVLHLVGAKEGYIARQFTNQFLLIGIKGGGGGGLAAIAFFAVAHWATAQFLATPAGDQIEALFGGLSVGWEAYAAILVMVLAVALITGITSRWAVYRFLEIFG